MFKMTLIYFVGCGNGKYLDVNPTIYKIGLDRCSSLANIARDKDHEVSLLDTLMQVTVVKNIQH